MSTEVQKILVAATCIAFMVSCMYGIYCLIVHKTIRWDEWGTILFATFGVVTLPSFIVVAIGKWLWNAMGGAKGLPRVLGIIGFVVGITMAFMGMAAFTSK